MIMAHGEAIIEFFFKLFKMFNWFSSLFAMQNEISIDHRRLLMSCLITTHFLSSIVYENKISQEEIKVKIKILKLHATATALI